MLAESTISAASRSSVSAWWLAGLRDTSPCNRAWSGQVSVRSKKESSINDSNVNRLAASQPGRNWAQRRPGDVGEQMEEETCRRAWESAVKIRMTVRLPWSRARADDAMLPLEQQGAFTAKKGPWWSMCIV